MDKMWTICVQCLINTGNKQGTSNFLNLKLGKQIYRRKYTLLLMLGDVIAWIKQIASNIPEGVAFTDWNQNNIDNAKDNFVKEF